MSQNLANRPNRSVSSAKLSTRALVIAVLEKIQYGQSLASLLEPLLSQVGEKDRGFAHELLLGTLRQWWALSRVGESLIDTEVTDKGVWAGLNIGLYQLLYMDTPDYAAIGETVEAVKQLDKAYGAGLINAILRKVQKNPAKFAKKIEKNHSLPNWLAYDLKQDWGEQYSELGQALRQSAPIFLRVNEKFCSLLDYANLLDTQHIGYELQDMGCNLQQAIRLTDNIKITELPKFATGWVSIQDLHAQIAGHIIALLNIGKPLTILDACAAPGGKTAHLLELGFAKKFHVKHLTALDNDPKRLKRVEENLQRLQLNGTTLTDNATNNSTNHLTVVRADATTFKPKEKFDVILLDAPCTATGVIRRHPDIALLRGEQDVAQTVDLQADILENLWQSLADNGYLLYVTCSLLKVENVTQLEHFLANHPEAKTVEFELTLPNQFKQAIGWQCLPLDEQGGDGFYYALLQKTGENNANI